MGIVLKRLFAGLVIFGAAGSLPAETVTPPDGWSSWAPRAEIAPRTYIDNTHSRGHQSLAISGEDNPAVFGGWQRTWHEIAAGRWYSFRAAYRATGVDEPAWQVVARLDWMDAGGKRVGQPDYPWKVTAASGGWNTVTLDVQAPPEAVAVKIQLLLLNAPRATVWWDEVSLEPAAAPGPRPVTVAAVNLYPHQNADPIGQVLALLEKSLPARSDIVVIGEGITAVGTRKSDVDAAEPIPGPTTARLGAFARERHTWLVAGMYERNGKAVYNTAVLIDREGQVAGRYRKVYLPREDLEAGLTPGNEYPVFRTDFGTIGLMVCWDSQYSDPARALALHGAELILLPIWGGNETLVKARAIENHVFLASAGYDYPTHILDPNGMVLAQASEQGTIATATIDLNRRYLDPWLGNMRDRFMKELRADVPVTDR